MHIIIHIFLRLSRLFTKILHGRDDAVCFLEDGAEVLVGIFRDSRMTDLIEKQTKRAFRLSVIKDGAEKRCLASQRREPVTGIEGKRFPSLGQVLKAKKLLLRNKNSRGTLPPRDWRRSSPIFNRALRLPECGHLPSADGAFLRLLLRVPQREAYRRNPSPSWRGAEGL